MLHGLRIHIIITQVVLKEKMFMAWLWKGWDFTCVRRQRGPPTPSFCVPYILSIWLTLTFHCQDVLFVSLSRFIESNAHTKNPLLNKLVFRQATPEYTSKTQWKVWKNWLQKSYNTISRLQCNQYSRDMWPNKFELNTTHHWKRSWSGESPHTTQSTSGDAPGDVQNATVPTPFATLEQLAGPILTSQTPWLHRWLFCQTLSTVWQAITANGLLVPRCLAARSLSASVWSQASYAQWQQCQETNGSVQNRLCPVIDQCQSVLLSLWYDVFVIYDTIYQICHMGSIWRNGKEK